jgi:hypothetical protein
MFDMAERTVTLRGGRFDGKQVEIDATAREFWVYQNMYNQPRTVKPGGFPRSESMVTYRVQDGADVAEHSAGS